MLVNVDGSSGPQPYPKSHFFFFFFFDAAFFCAVTPNKKRE